MVLHNHRKGRARYIGSDDFIYIICKYLYTTNPSDDFPTSIRNITFPPSPQNSQRDITSLHFIPYPRERTGTGHRGSGD